MGLTYIAYQDAKENFVFYYTGSMTNKGSLTLVSIFWSPLLTKGRTF